MTDYAEVARGVLVAQHPNGRTNAVIVVGSRRTVVIDAHHLPSDGEALLSKTCEVSSGYPDFLFLTHGHLDHIGGSQAFSCPIVASLGTQKMISELWTAWYDRQALAVRSPEMAALEVRRPDVVFDTGLRLNLGADEAQFISVGGHVPGHSVVYLPSRGVLVASDLVLGPVYLGDGEPLEYMESARRMSALPADVVVPGHGDPGGSELLGRTAETINGFVERVRLLIDKGHDADFIAREVCTAQNLPEAFLQRVTGNVQRLLKKLR